MPDRDRNVAVYAHLTDALKFLEGVLAMHVEAEELYEALPQRHRERIDASNDTAEINLIHALVRTQREFRTEQRARFEEVVERLRELLADEQFKPIASFDTNDLKLVVEMIGALRTIGPRSKRELARFFEAMNVRDRAALVALTFPSRGAGRDEGRQKLEVRFAYDLSAETKEVLGLPRTSVSHSDA